MHAIPCQPCLYEREQRDGVLATAIHVGHIRFNPEQRYICPDCHYMHTESRSYKWERRALTFVGMFLITLAAVTTLYVLRWDPLWSAGAVGATAALINLVNRFGVWLEDALDPAELDGWDDEHDH